MAKTQPSTRKRSTQDVARETLRRLIGRKTLTHDDGVRGTHAGLYLCALALEEVAAFAIGQAERDMRSSDPGDAHSLWACTTCGFLAAFDDVQTERLAQSDEDFKVGAHCPLCGEVALHPLPPKAKGPR